MKKNISTSNLDSVPVVIFQRLHVDTNEPISLHAIVFESISDAHDKARWIDSQSHLALIGITDAVFNESTVLEEVQRPPMDVDEYGKRLDDIHGRIAKRLGENSIVFYSAYTTDNNGLPIDNLDDIAIEGRVKFHVTHDPFWGSGNPYSSHVVESPTWLDIAVLANKMIKTTGNSHHHYLENVLIVDEDDGTKIAQFLMGS